MFFVLSEDEIDEQDEQDESTKRGGKQKSKFVSKTDRLMNGNVYLIRNVKLVFFLSIFMICNPVPFSLLFLPISHSPPSFFLSISFSTLSLPLSFYRYFIFF
jgi:hypothetical protein